MFIYIYILFVKFASRILCIDFSTLLEVMKRVLFKEQFGLIYLFSIVSIHSRQHT